MGRKAIIAAVLLLAGTATPAHASIGVWGIPSTTSGQQALLNHGVKWVRAQHGVTPLAGFKTLVSIRDTIPTDRTGASAFEDDEPNGPRHIPVATLQAQAAAVQQLGARLVVTLDMDLPNWRAYATGSQAQILAVDSYPTRSAPYAHIGPRVAKLKAIAGARPVWAILQVCSSGIFTQGAMGMPHRAQEQRMARAAKRAGASMIWFFGGNYKACYSQSDTDWNWTAWHRFVLPTINQLRGVA